jgi:hypothetical protein
LRHHKSIGVLIFLLMIARLLWRYFNRQPRDLGGIPVLVYIAHVLHVCLYLLPLLQPLSGILMSQAYGYPVVVFGWFTLPPLVWHSPSLGGFFREVHGVTAVLLTLTVCRHPCRGGAETSFLSTGTGRWCACSRGDSRILHTCLRISPAHGIDDFVVPHFSTTMRRAAMHQVMIHPATYETVRAAVDRAFDLFPLDLKDKKVLIKPNVLRASDAAEGIVTHPAVLAAVVDKVETMAPASIIVGDNPACSATAPTKRPSSRPVSWPPPGDTIATSGSMRSVCPFTLSSWKR